MSISEVAKSLEYVSQDRDSERQWKKVIEGLKQMTRMQHAQVWKALSAKAEPDKLVLLSQYKVLYKAAIKEMEEEIKPPCDCICDGSWGQERNWGGGGSLDGGVLRVIEDYDNALRDYKDFLTAFQGDVERAMDETGGRVIFHLPSKDKKNKDDPHEKKSDLSKHSTPISQSKAEEKRGEELLKKLSSIENNTNRILAESEKGNDEIKKHISETDERIHEVDHKIDGFRQPDLVPRLASVEENTKEILNETRKEREEIKLMRDGIDALEKSIKKADHDEITEEIQAEETHEEHRFSSENHGDTDVQPNITPETATASTTVEPTGEIGVDDHPSEEEKRLDEIKEEEIPVHSDEISFKKDDTEITYAENSDGEKSVNTTILPESSQESLPSTGRKPRAEKTRVQVVGKGSSRQTTAFNIKSSKGTVVEEVGAGTRGLMERNQAKRAGKNIATGRNFGNQGEMYDPTIHSPYQQSQKDPKHIAERPLPNKAEAKVDTGLHTQGSTGIGRLVSTGHLPPYPPH